MAWWGLRQFVPSSNLFRNSRMDYLDAFVALLVRCLLGQPAPARTEACFQCEAGCELRPVWAPRVLEGLPLGRGAVVCRGIVPDGRRRTPARVVPRAALAGVGAVCSNFGLPD